MLVLERYRKEGVRVGDELLVTVIDIDPNGEFVKLGFLAPDKVRILREEIWNKNKMEEAHAANKT